MTDINLATGLLTGVQFKPSPHFDIRPLNTSIDLLVVHGISLPPGVFGGNYIDALFQGELPIEEHPYFSTIAGQRVSAHLLIRRDGSVTQFVSFNQRAWHAGVSSFAGRNNCNDFSIGIELEGTDDLPYESQQYQQLAIISRLLVKAYPGITAERIVGHSDIAPGRKTDPGSSFDWHLFRNLLIHC